MKSYQLDFIIYSLIFFHSALSLAMSKPGFRCYDACEKRDFYETQHKNQTLSFVKSQIAQLEPILQVISHTQ